MMKCDVCDFLWQFDAMVAIALRSTDELFHVHLYDWFRSVNLTDKLIEVRNPSHPLLFNDLLSF